MDQGQDKVGDGGDGEGLWSEAPHNTICSILYFSSTIYNIRYDKQDTEDGWVLIEFHELGQMPPG